MNRPDLDCLGSSPFGCKPKDYRYWISLDFLGFPRAKRAFSMGYAGCSEKKIWRPLCRERVGAGEGEGGPEGLGIVHGTSVARLPFFCNQLSYDWVVEALRAFIALSVGMPPSRRGRA